ncbi:MAG: hypothetical protein GX347_00095 [Epulopiscium sp.]|nr:hypothetical protein [Candidatus Epulonipiscium sp.]
MEFQLLKKWIFLIISICVISLGGFLIYYMYQNKAPSTPTRGIFVMHEVESLPTAYVGEFNGYIY